MGRDNEDRVVQQVLVVLGKFWSLMASEVDLVDVELHRGNRWSFFIPWALPSSFPGDMYSHDGDADEPEWVKTEREQFVEFRDKNRDGKMDKEETKDWILPSDYDHAEAEARHLVYESDQNKV